MKKYLSLLLLIGLVIPSITLAATLFQRDAGNTLTTNLISFYKMDGNANDYYSTNNLTNTGSVSFVNGKIASSSDTGASNSTKDLTITSNLGVTGGPASINVWFKSYAATYGTDHPAIVSWFDDGTDVDYRIFIGATGVGAARHRANVVWDELGQTAISADTWYMATLTYDGTTLIFYLDGVEKARAAKSGNGAGAWTSGLRVFLGAAGAPTRTSGLVDELGVWSRALTVAEITNLYRLSRGQTMCSAFSIDCNQYTNATTSYSYSGSVVTWNPTNGDTAQITAVGAGGGKAQYSLTGAAGGVATGTLIMTAGTPYYLLVGQSLDGNSTSTAIGGGGSGGKSGDATPTYGGTGGGMSWFGTANTFSTSTAIVVGAGGAGGGQNGSNGAGGGTTGGAGTGSGSCSGGQGGTQSAGGSGGQNASAGTMGQGGQGAMGQTGGAFGGGGGGGYYGGGGGGGISSQCTAGGGGGSSYTKSTLLSASTVSGGGSAGSVSGSIFITYDTALYPLGATSNRRHTIGAGLSR